MAEHNDSGLLETGSLVSAKTAERAGVPANPACSGFELSWLPFAALALLVGCLFAIRLAGPSNLMDQDQERPAAYVLDAVKNGHWICQRDLFGMIMSKPPVYTWLCALLTVATGQISRFTLYLPDALAALGTAWLVFAYGRARFGTRAGWFAALACLFCAAGLKSLALARTDTVFAFTVTATAFLAYRAWIREGGWTWVWLAAAVATLTKGPLGVVLAAGGLLAAAWERRTGEPHPVLGSHWAGVALFLALAGGWFLLAYWQMGHALFDVMLGRELVSHAVGAGRGRWPGALLYQPALYYLGRAAPWSLLAYYGLWRIWKHPAGEAAERRFERFLFCWFTAGLLLFSLAPHQRADLLWPLMPAGALIAGRELSRLTAAWSALSVCRWATATAVLIVGGCAVGYLGPWPQRALVTETVAIKRLAEEIERNGGREFPLTHVDAPMTLQIYLHTLRPQATYAQAARLLRGPEAAFVAVTDVARLRATTGARGGPLHILDAAGTTPGRTAIVGNRPPLRASTDSAFYFGPILVRMHGARLLQATEREFAFAAADGPGEVLLSNESGQPRTVRASIADRNVRHSQAKRVASGETWRIETRR